MWWAIYLDRDYHLRYVGPDGSGVSYDDAHSIFIDPAPVREFGSEAEALEASRAARVADAGSAERFRDFSAVPARRSR